MQITESHNNSTSHVNDMTLPIYEIDGTGGGGGSSSSGGSSGNTTTPIDRIDDIVPPATPVYTYTVKVVERGTYTPIQGAFVNCTTLQRIGTTNASGIVTFSVTDGTNRDSVTCNVSATGYITNNNITVNKNSTKQVILTKEINSYYYSCKVVEQGTESVISDATVEVFRNDETSSCFTISSGENGIYTYQTNHNETIKFKVSKDGFISSNKISIESYTNISEINSHLTTITLRKQKIVNYYYVIKAIDTNYNLVEGVKVKLYDDMLRGRVWSPYSVELNGSGDSTSVLFDILQYILSSILGVNSSEINGDTQLEEIGAFDSANINRITLEIGEETGLSISDSEFSTLSTINAVITYFKNSGNYQDTHPIPVTIFTTDNNGFISLLTGNSSGDRKFVEVIYLPEGYVEKSSTGYVNATTSCVINLESHQQEQITYYYDFEIKDSLTGKPVANADVTYTYTDVIHSETTTFTGSTNDSGRIGVQSPFVNLDITISKTNYNTFSSNFPGSEDHVLFKLSLVPKNSIRVVDGDGIGVENIVVDICKDDNTIMRNGKTDENGYIDTNIYQEIYFTTYFYAVIKKYGIGQLLSPGENKITLTSTEDVLYEDEFEKFNEMSVNRMKKNIAGNIGVTYNTDDFKMKILDPDSIITYDIFTGTPVMMDDNQKRVIGSVNITLKPDANDLRLKVVNRYSGYYNPIFKDVLFYDNYRKNGKEYPFSNTGFDEDYKDNYGKFGVINNMWFHKVNDNKDMEIINTLTPYYPLTGQYCLDYRDYNIFESSWDINHYTRQLDIEHSEGCDNISSMKNGLCMFGSKYLNVPKSITIEGLTLGSDDSWKGEWNDDWITNQDGCPGEIMFKEVNNNSVDFYLFFRKRILRYFRDKLRGEFNKYIDADYHSFGKPGLDDDIDEYVEKNVLKLYKVEKVRVFIKRTKIGQHNSRIENDYTSYLEYSTADLRSKGFVEVNNITLTKMNRDDFDRKLVYNLRNGMREEFGFNLILTKI